MEATKYLWKYCFLFQKKSCNLSEECGIHNGAVAEINFEKLCFGLVENWKSMYWVRQKSYLPSILSHNYISSSLEIGDAIFSLADSS